MYIRSIQIQGFKSFPDRTLLEFGPGISAIVGPNGCGKSNILDALRWCFGTQSARQLRGASMQDVVFAGTEGRPRSGFAEVAVTFVNEDGRAPAAFKDAPEIRIERRLTRDGEGEYRMQGGRVRLRDVQDFLMDIGYGEYSLIQQGTIGQLVQAKPAEIRQLLEQAGRMSKYRARREEAQGRLAATEGNLARLDDLIAESARLVRSLERQAARAREGRALEAELRTVRGALVARRIAAGRADAEAASKVVEAMKQSLAALDVEIGRHDADLAAAHAELEMLEGQQMALDEAWRAWRVARDQAVAREAALAAELQSQEALAEAQAATIGEIEAQLLEDDKLIAAAAEKTKACETALAASEARRLAVVAEREQIDTERRELFASRDAARERLVEALRRHAEASNRWTTAKLEREHAEARATALAAERALLLASLQAAEVAWATAAEAAEIAAEAKAARGAEAESAESALAAARDSLRAARAELDRAITVHESDRRELERLQTALAETTPGELEGWTNPWLRIEPRKGWAGLAETALAARLRVLIGGSREAAKARVLAPGDARWAFLLGPSRAEGEPAPGYRRIREILNLPDELREPIARLTAGVWLSDDAVDAEAPLPPGDWEEIWDNEGRCLDRRGVVSAGPLAREGVAHLAASRAECEARLTASAAARSVAADACERRTRQLEMAERQAEAARDALQAADRAARNAAVELERRTEERRRLEQECLRLDEAHRGLLERAAKAGAREAAADRERMAAEAGLAEVRAEAEALEARLAPMEAAWAKAEAAVGEAVVAARELAVALEQSRGVERSLRTARDGRAKALEAARSETEARRVRIDELRHRRGEAHKEAEALAAEGDRLAEARQKTQELMIDFRNRQSELSRILRNLNEKRSRTAGLYAEAQRKVDAALATMESARTSWHARFGDVELPNADADERTDEDLKTRDAALERELAALGAWDAEAEAAYARERARHDDLAAQREDLTASIAALRESIARMNRESRERFRATFEEIDRRFRDMFVRLFGGGHAELRLSDPEDWLESGVEIVARPPGTQLQRLELLSGGQSAMTAIALILAIFSTHPSPFCILDEVDAPLDDANVSRFNQVVVELSRIAQIFLITHNKATMEIGGTLYGITMETRGISRAIAVRLA